MRQIGVLYSPLYGIVVKGPVPMAIPSGRRFFFLSVQWWRGLEAGGQAGGQAGGRADGDLEGWC